MTLLVTLLGLASLARLLVCLLACRSLALPACGVWFVGGLVVGLCAFCLCACLCLSVLVCLCVVGLVVCLVVWFVVCVVLVVVCVFVAFVACVLLVVLFGLCVLALFALLGGCVVALLRLVCWSLVSRLRVCCAAACFVLLGCLVCGVACVCLGRLRVGRSCVVSLPSCLVACFVLAGCFVFAVALGFAVVVAWLLLLAGWAGASFTTGYVNLLIT